MNISIELNEEGVMVFSLCLCQISWGKCHGTWIYSFLLAIGNCPCHLPVCSAGFIIIIRRICVVRLQFLKHVANIS